MLDLSSVHVSLTVASRRLDDGIRVEPSGEIDLSTVGILDRELCALTGLDHITVDMTGVSFLGAVGIRVLLRCARDQRAGGWSFRLIGLRPHHLRLFEQLGILDELTTAIP